MKTGSLIALLARGPVAADAVPPERGLAAAVGFGLVIAAATMLSLLGTRPDLVRATLQPMFWLKIAFPVTLALAAFVATARLARPGERARLAGVAGAATCALVWAMALASLAAVPAAERGALVAGSTALPCVVSIVLLSLPLFAAASFALRAQAPTRLRLAGAAAGLLAGAVAAAVYAWHCTEMALPFLAVWYALGMALPAGLGALVGPRLLRWR